jgi:hypothetical protein
MRLTRTETNLNEAEQRNKQMVDQATKVKKEHTNLVIPNDPYLSLFLLCLMIILY